MYLTENSPLKPKTSNTYAPSVRCYNKALGETLSVLKSLKIQREKLKMNTQAGQNIYLLVSRLMQTVSNECSQNRSALADIKMALSFAQQNGCFNTDSSSNVLQTKKTLLKYSAIISQQEKVICKSITDFSELVEQEKKKTEEKAPKTIAAKVSQSITKPSLGLKLFVAGAFICMMDSDYAKLTSNRKLAVFGAAGFLTMTTGFLDEHPDTGMDKALAILNNLRAKLRVITSFAEQFCVVTGEMIDSYINLSSEWNTVNHSHACTRSSIPLINMIEKTEKLQEFLQSTEDRAKSYAIKCLDLERAGTESDDEKTKKKNFTGMDYGTRNKLDKLYNIQPRGFSKIDDWSSSSSSDSSNNDDFEY